VGKSVAVDREGGSRCHAQGLSQGQRPFELVGAVEMSNGQGKKEKNTR
jgi:hypothetical protein